MKKAMIAVTLLGLMGNAYALDASQVFTWSGNVPAAPTVNGWVIAQPDGNEIPRGILVFNTAADGFGELVGSTELRFKVFEEDVDNVGKPDTNKPVDQYNYTMTSLVVNNSNSGLAAEQVEGGYFAIQALNGGIADQLEKNLAVPALEEETILSVVKSENFVAPGNQPKANDSVDVQATIVVNEII